MTSSPIVVIVGASSKHDKDGQATDLPPESRWGLAGGLAMTFAAAGFHVVLTARRAAVLEDMAASVREYGAKKMEEKGATPNKVVCFSCDVTKDDQVSQLFTSVKEEFGATRAGDYFIDCLIFNASPAFPEGFSFGEGAPMPHELDVNYMNMAYDVQVGGIIRCMKEVVPDMLAAGKGCLLLSGATMQIRGGARFGALAPGKTALRSLGQSMYQAYGPKGIHVCNINIDGVIDSPNTRNWMSVEKLMNPLDIGEQYLAMYRQGRSVWSYELQITPHNSASSVGMRM
eukprot:TRINITY_DN22798_c0_g1_i1.p1 TRINITY_DN22798_c0_g1~~TRINITY_DN22798_c0_g1_i1.p1  ORF type:complete len:301 (+),score=47.29 TRINITY_DN22798_c0_g1_i1:48-905(+)